MWRFELATAGARGSMEGLNLRAYFAAIRELPRPFWVLVGATFVNRFGVFVWPFLTIFITRQGHSAVMAGWAVTSYSAGSFIAAGVGGWMADRLGRNITMGMSSLGGAAMMMVLSQAAQLPALVITAFFLGLISECGHAAGSALVQDIVPEEQHVLAYSIERFAVNLGWSLGPLCAGLLAERSFFWLFAVDAITSAFFGIVAIVALPRGRMAEKTAASWGPAWASIRSNTPFLMLFGACFCGTWCFRQMNTTFMLHIERTGHSMGWSGAVQAMNGIMIVTLEIVFTALTRGVRVHTMLALGYALMGLCFLVLIGACPLWAFFLCMVIFTVGEMCTFSRYSAYLASLSPEDMRGRYQGFLNLAWAISGMVASIGGLSLYDYSPSAVWIVTAVLGVCAALFMLASRATDRAAGRLAALP
jgi:MFS family permease